MYILKQFCLSCQIFERLIFNNVKHLFYSNFDAAQFGFRENSSTTCALIKLHNYLPDHYDNPAVTGVQIVTLDYSKAFDTLDHNIIVHKLVNCNFPLSFIKLVYSYLDDRCQRVRVSSVLSDSASVTSGVPQGSILGPSLFSLVMSDLQCVHTSTGMIKFADDVNFIFPIYHSVNHVADEVQNVICWSRSVLLRLQTKKCKYLFVAKRKDSVPVHIADFEFCTSLKILGIYFCNNLKWDAHFSHIYTITNRRAYAFRVLKPNLTKSELLSIYKLLILPLIEYCAPLFVGLNKKNRHIIKRIQRKFHNIICFFNCHCDILPDVSNRRLTQSTNLYVKAHCEPTHVLHDVIPFKRTFFNQPVSKSDIRKRAFIPFVTEIVNTRVSRT